MPDPTFAEQLQLDDDTPTEPPNARLLIFCGVLLVFTLIGFGTVVSWVAEEVGRWLV